MKPKRVVILAFDRIQALDLVGPMEVFDAAGRLRASGYAVEVVAPGGGSIALSNGLRIEVSGSLETAGGRIDTLLVAGGDGARAAASDPDVLAWVRDAAGRSRRVVSVCTGAFVLAAAGLLDGRRATTHWAWCEALAERHPGIDVEADPIFVRDGKYATSAGVTAGMDLALALVEEDFGRETALAAARWLVLFLKRPGGQSQFSAGLAGQMADREPLRELQAWLPDNLTADLSVAALAERAFMSPRNFARAFRRETGQTPAAYVEGLRVERARAMLEEGAAGLDAIAAACGFGTVETLRRAFHRHMHVGPAAYRSRFRGPAAA